MRTRISHQPIVPGLRFEVCRLVKLKLGDCLYCFWSNQQLCIRLFGGERAGAIAGAVVGSPACASICRTVAGSVIKPIRRTRPPHPLHVSAHTP